MSNDAYIGFQAAVVGVDDTGAITNKTLVNTVNVVDSLAGSEDDYFNDVGTAAFTRHAADQEDAVFTVSTSATA